MISKTIFAMVLVVLVGTIFIITTENLDVKDKQDQKTLFVTMKSWIENLIKNVISLTGYAAKQNWSPQVQNTTSSS